MTQVESFCIKKYGKPWMSSRDICLEVMAWPTSLGSSVCIVYIKYSVKIIWLVKEVDLRKGDSWLTPKLYLLFLQSLEMFPSHL